MSGVVTLNDGRRVVLAVGGQEDFGNPLKTELYDIAAGSWELRPDFNFPSQRSAGLSFVLNGKMHILGGKIVNNNYHESVIFFEESNESGLKWETLSQFLPHGINGATLAIQLDYPLMSDVFY